MKKVMTIYSSFSTQLSPPHLTHVPTIYLFVVFNHWWLSFHNTFLNMTLNMWYRQSGNSYLYNSTEYPITTPLPLLLWTIPYPFFSASCADHTRFSHAPSPQSHSQQFADRLDRSHTPGPRDSRSFPSTYRESSQPDLPPPNPQKQHHRLNNVSVAKNPKTVVLDPPDDNTWWHCHNCKTDDHEDNDCQEVCTISECQRSAFIQRHLHCDCPYYN